MGGFLIGACAVDLSTPCRPSLYLLSCLLWLGALALVSVASTLILAILVYVDTVKRRFSNVVFA
jgi:hypothetical protein